MVLVKQKVNIAKSSQKYLSLKIDKINMLTISFNLKRQILTL